MYSHSDGLAIAIIQGRAATVREMLHPRHGLDLSALRSLTLDAIDDSLSRYGPTAQLASNDMQT